MPVSLDMFRQLSVPTPLIDSKIDAVAEATKRNKLALLPHGPTVEEMDTFSMFNPNATDRDKLDYAAQVQANRLAALGSQVSVGDIIQDGAIGAVDTVAGMVLDGAAMVAGTVANPSAALETGSALVDTATQLGQTVADVTGKGNEYRDYVGSADTAPSKEYTQFENFLKNFDNPLARTGNYIAKNLNKSSAAISEYLGGLKSESGNTLSEASAAASQGYERERMAMLPENATSDQIQEATLDVAKNWMNSAQGEGVAVSAIESLPYLFAAGKAANMGGKAARAAQIKKNPMGVSGKSIERATKAGEVAASTAAVSALEGAGNSADIYNQLSTIAPETFAEHSQPYRDLIAEGKTSEQAIDELSRKAAVSGGLSSGILAGVANLVTGGVADRALSGLNKVTLGKVVGSGASETVEEALQSATGVIASNQAEQKYADDTKDTNEGVINAAVEGAVVGGISAGATTATVAATSTGAKKAVQGAGKLSEMNEVRKAKAAEKKAAASLTGDEQVDNILKEAQAAAVVNSTGSEKAKEQLQQSDNPLIQEMLSGKIDPKEAARKAVLNAQAMKAVKVTKGEDTEAEDKALSEISALTPELAQVAPKGSSTENVKKVTKSFNETINSKTELSAEEVDDLVGDLLGDLSFQINPEDEIEESAITALVTALNTAGASAGRIAQVMRQFDATKSADQVSNDIRIGDREWKGAAQYLHKINQGISNGAPAYTAVVYDELNTFAEHMNSKLAAFNSAMEESAKTKKPVTPVGPAGTDYGKNAYVHYKASKDLILKMEEDVELLNATLASAGIAIEYDWSTDDLTQTLEELGLNPVRVESPKVKGISKALTELGTDEAAKLVEEVAASPTGWTTTNVLKANKLLKQTPPLASEPVKETSPEEAGVKSSTLQEEMTTAIASVINPSAKKHLPKEQVKTAVATQFIGAGAKGSSTENYREMYSSKSVANTGSYTKDDVIYVSSNGKRGNRVNPVKDGALQGVYTNLIPAMDAGATIIMDTAEHLNRTSRYNIGEMALANYLEDHGYERVGASGKWIPSKNRPKSLPTVFKEEVAPILTAGAKKLATGGTARRLLQRTYALLRDGVYRDSNEAFEIDDTHNLEEGMSLVDAVQSVGKTEKYTQEEIDLAINAIEPENEAQLNLGLGDPSPAPVVGLPAIINEPLHFKAHRILNEFSNALPLTDSEAASIKRAAQKLTPNLDVKEAISAVVKYMAGGSKKDQLLNNSRHSPAAITAAEKFIREGALKVPIAVRSVGQKSVENLVNPSEVHMGMVLPENTSPEDAAYFGKNEFKEEIIISKDSAIANNPDSTLMEVTTDGIAKAFANRIDNLGKGLQRFSRNRVMRFAKEGITTKNERYHKAKTHYQNLLMESTTADYSDSKLNPVIHNSILVAIGEYIGDSSLYPNTPQLKAFLGLSSLRGDVPPAVYKHILREDGSLAVGDEKGTLIMSLGATVIKAMGASFSGEHANTRDRFQAAVGELALSYMVKQGIIEQIVYSQEAVVALNNAGAEMSPFQNTTFKINHAHPMVAERVANKGIIGANEFIAEIGVQRESTHPTIRYKAKPISKIKGSAAELSPTLETAMTEMGKVPHYLNQRMNQWYTGMGDLFKYAVGYKDVSESADELLDNTKDKVLGKNLTITREIEMYEGFLGKMSAAGVDAFKEAFYYPYVALNNNRIATAVNGFDYQSSKMHRFLSNLAPVSMQVTKQGDTANERKFLVAVAQGLGVKVEKNKVNTALIKLAEKEEEFSDVFEAADNVEAGTATEVDYMLLSDFAASNEKMHTLMALAEYAAYKAAVAKGEQSFDVTLPIELDGMNNGPVTFLLATVAMFTGSGGLPFDVIEKYFSKAGISHSDSEGAASAIEDGLSGLYEEAYSTINGAIKETINILKSDPTYEDDLRILNAQLRLKVGAGLFELDEKTGDILAKRDEAKPVVTESFYGSGDRSLTSSDARGMIQGAYGKLQEAYDLFLADDAGNIDYVIAVYNAVHTDLSEASGLKKSAAPVVKRSAIKEALNIDLVKMYQEALEAALLTPEYQKQQGSEGFGYSDIKLKAIRSNNENINETQFGSAYATMSMMTEAMSAVGAFADITRQKVLERYRKEDGVSRFEEVSTARLAEANKEIMGSIPSYSLNIHEDKTGFSDAIPAVKRGKSVEATSRNRYGLVDSGNTVYPEVMAYTPVGAAAVPYLALAIADASVFAPMLKEVPNSMPVFDGDLFNALSPVPPMNQKYLDSIRDNNLAAIVQGGFNRGIAAIAPLFDINTGAFSEDLSNAQIKQVLLTQHNAYKTAAKEHNSLVDTHGKVEVAYNFPSFEKLVASNFKKVNGKLQYVVNPKAPIAIFMAAALRGHQEAVNTYATAPTLKDALLRQFPEGVTVDQFTRTDGNTEVYSAADSTLLNGETVNEFYEAPEPSDSNWDIRHIIDEPFVQEGNRENYHPEVLSNPSQDSWLKETDINKTLFGENTKTARGFLVKLNKFIDASSASNKPTVAKFFKKVLNKNILAPALAQMASKGTLPTVVVTNTAGLKETFSKSPEHKLKGILRAKGITQRINGKTTIFLNEDMGGITAETLLHELVHAVLDTNLEAMSQSNKSFARLLAQMKDIAAQELKENRINPQLVTYNSKELFAWGLTNIDVITSLAQKDQMEVEQSREKGWAAFVGAFLNILKRVINTIAGTKVHENSVLSYLVDTAANLAGRNLKETYDGSEKLSFQSTASNTFKASPQDVFNKLLQQSQRSDTFNKSLDRMFTQEVVALQASKDEVLSEYANNAVDALTELSMGGTVISGSPVSTVFHMNEVETYMFDNYRHIIGAALEGMAPSSDAISKLYTQARKQIAPKDFLLSGETINDPLALEVAQKKWDTIFLGATRTAKKESADNVTGKRHRSAYMAEFVAMAKTNEEFQNVLRKRVLNIPDADKEYSAVQNWILSTVQKLLQLFGDTRRGTRHATTYATKLNILSRNLTTTEFRAKSRMEQRAGTLLEKTGAVYSTYAKNTDAAIKRIINSTTATGIKKGAHAAWALGKRSIQGQHNIEQAARYNELEKAMVHGKGAWMSEVVEDVSNTTEGNKYINRLFYKKNKATAGERDGKIKAASDVISKWLGSVVRNKHASKAITNTILVADLGSLLNSFGLDAAINLYTDSNALNQAIAERRKKLGTTPVGNALNRSATSLGHFMVHGVGTEAITFPNATEIVSSLGAVHRENVTSYRDIVDELATLVAMQQTSKDDANVLVNAFKSHPEGVRDSVNLHQQFKEYDLLENLRGKTRSTLKGRTDVIRDSNRDIKIVTEEEAKTLHHDGYTRHRTMNTVDGVKVVMFSDTNGQGTYTQGAYSTVISNKQGFANMDGRALANGIDSYDEINKKSGKYTELYEDMVRNLGTNKQTHTINKDGLVVKFNSYGGVMLSNVLPKKEIDMLLGTDSRFEQVLPHMFGRTAEISRAGTYNEEVNKALVHTYNQDKAAGNLRNYIEISADAPTARGREAYRMMPPAAREHMRSIWGSAFYVKAPLFTKIYGYRKASVANVLKKNSDSPKWAQALIRQTLGVFFSDRTLIRAISVGERAITELVGNVKDWIVVRGIWVLLDNVISNTVELVLLNDGMTIAKAIKYQIEGMRLAKRYQEDEARLRRIAIDILGKAGDDRKRLVDESLQLQEELAKNNARTLIDLGFMSAIVEDVGADENVFSYGHRLGEKFDSQFNKLPESLQWVAGNLSASRESEWYKTAYKFTQLSDFSSRYAMFKNMQEQNQGEVSPSQLDDIADAFVNYDLPSNKYIQYLGDMGLVWFLKYFMRIQKVIIKGTIKNPRKAMEFATARGIGLLDVANYYQAFFMFNPITNKFGPLNYTEKGLESLPAVQLVDAF